MSSIDAGSGPGHRAGPRPDERGGSWDLSADPTRLAAQLVDCPSVSGAEAEIADRVQDSLVGCAHLEVQRFGNTVVARTELARESRVVVAGHLDTVPAHDNLPSRVADGILYGLGSCDMKAGVAVGLHLAGTLTAPVHDVTYLFYECEEVDAERNGLTQLSRSHPELLVADFAVLMEPSNAVVEAGCQGTVRFEIELSGQRAHSARSWMGKNAIHGAAEVLGRLADYRPRQPEIDGLLYHEGMNAVAITGGVAGNVIPDQCLVTVNHRFAPDRTAAEAVRYCEDFFAPHQIKVVDASPAARPGLGVPAAAAFVAAVGGRVNPKFGWTDVARFAELGIPAVNFGPGDPRYAHRQDEQVPLAQVTEVHAQLRAWLSQPVSTPPTPLGMGPPPDTGITSPPTGATP